MADGWSDADITVNYPVVGRTRAREWASKVIVACFGGPCSMKMGNTASRSHFDAALYSTQGLPNACQTCPEPHDNGVGPEYRTSHAPPQREALNTSLCIAHICAILRNDW
jgi:hypothetical protein